VNAAGHFTLTVFTVTPRNGVGRLAVQRSMCGSKFVLVQSVTYKMSSFLVEKW